MGQYKVPQNVEAEDKIIGWLSFKQLIYVVIGLLWGGLCFLIFRRIPSIMVILGVPVVLLFLLLGLYQRDGQNFEQLLIALVGFFSQARKRIWVKEAIVESFKIEPVKVEAASEQSQRRPEEVRSRLEELATTVDSRGWSAKYNADLGEAPPEPTLIMPQTNNGIVGAAPVAPEVEPTDVMDISSSPLAQNLSELLNEAAQEVREDAVKAAMEPAPEPKKVPAAPTAPSGVTPTTSGMMQLATEDDGLTVSQLAAKASRLATLAEGEAVPLRNGN